MNGWLRNFSLVDLGASIKRRDYFSRLPDGETRLADRLVTADLLLGDVHQAGDLFSRKGLIAQQSDDAVARRLLCRARFGRSARRCFFCFSSKGLDEAYSLLFI